MRILLLIFGVLLLLAGSIWILQGINLLGGSFMSGQSRWTWIGLGTFVFGMIAILFSRRK